MTEESGKITVTNPATGEIAGTAKLCNADDVNAAVEKAYDAFLKWSAVGANKRAAILFKTAELVRRNQDELARLLTTEQGKILPEAKNEVQGFAAVYEFYASITGTARNGDALPKSDYGYAFTMREPIGVCGAIIPWNMPVLIMAWKTAPAIAAGNSIVLKPSAKTPLCALAIAALAKEAGMPDGVLEIVTGSGEGVGRALAQSRNIASLSFTGSVATGKEVEKLSCGTGKRLIMELGGSDPMVVCADADIDKAVAGAVSGRFYNCGQTCTAVKRLFVADEIADEFTEKLKAATAKITVGNGILKGIRMGPLNSREGLAGIESALERKGSGEVVSGGNRLTEGAFGAGNFFEPTIVLNPDDKSPLLSEEVFGPVLPVVSVDSLESAIEYANRTPFGLGASVWTTSLKNSYTFAESVDAGIVWVNRHLRIPPEVPFGGEKASGYGRENGLDALKHYTRDKTVIISP
ncbi:MAG: aldehyde dehydrogenase [Methanomicrobium sp.]|nr:aldehyde dehydrogenase [Methanomicrobium sp.]